MEIGPKRLPIQSGVLRHVQPAYCPAQAVGFGRTRRTAVPASVGLKPDLHLELPVYLGESTKGRAHAIYSFVGLPPQYLGTSARLPRNYETCSEGRAQVPAAVFGLERKIRRSNYAAIRQSHLDDVLSPALAHDDTGSSNRPGRGGVRPSLNC